MTILDQKILASIGQSEALGPLLVQREDIIKYSIATCQQEQKFLSGDEAPPLFFMSLPWRLDELSDLAEDGLPDDDLVPEFPLDKRMGGGMRVEPVRPIIPGDVLSATRTLVDISEKQGRSGTLIFYEMRIDIQDSTGKDVMHCNDKRIMR